VAAAPRAIRLDGASLTREQVVAVARGARVVLDATQLRAVQRTADFLAEQVRRQEPLYGVSTGFGCNADRLLGAHRLRGDGDAGTTLHEELQENLITTHAVCIGEPFPEDVVRAMLVIRINTLMKGHSGVRSSTLEAYAAMLNAGIVPVVPKVPEDRLHRRLSAATGAHAKLAASSVLPAPLYVATSG
jgi:histidine ammonia-lyase